MTAQMKFVQADKAPPVLGPYSLGVQVGSLVFTAGQVGLDPETGRLVPGGVEVQARQAIANLAAILEAAGSSLSSVVKTTVFLEDIADYTAVNAVYAEYFGPDFPARSAVQVAALPGGAAVEIEAIGLVP